MDIHNNFDEFLDLRDQQEEGSVLQQHPHQDNKNQLKQEQESIMNGINEDNTTTSTTDNNGTTVPSWNLQGTGSSYLPHHNNNDTTTSSADAAAAAAAAAVVAGASVDPNQPFYFPLDTDGWASVFGASEMNTAALTAFMNDNQHQQVTTATTAEATATTATTANNSTDSNVSHFIPPQQMLLQQPVTTSTEVVHDNTNNDMDVDIPGTMVNDIDNKVDDNNDGDNDNKVKQEKQEEDTGRIRTRSSARLRTTVTKPTTTTTTTTTKSKKSSSPMRPKQEEPKDDNSETPKKKGKVKKLYCVCQKPYNGDPMVQCDQCTQWFHCECVDLDPDEAEDIEIWVCKDCEAKQIKKDDQEENQEENQEDVLKKEEQEQEKPEIKEEQTTERPYATRQAKVRKCLLPSCKNRTRADSYCSDVCASKDTMRQSGDSDYEPAKSPSPPRERRSRTSSASSISSSSVNITPTDSRKSSITSTTTITSKQERSSSKQPEIAPEDDPIRKNVVKNMSTVLKTIIQTALDKDPSLFSVTTTTTTTTTDDDTDQADTSQEKQEEQAQEEKSPEVMGDKIAHSIEQVMFKELRDTHTKRAGAHYKNKFRSLLHNLKDKANEGFQLRVITGELTPDDLVKMSSEDMANPELRSMSKSMRQESIKNSIMKHANVPIIKKTHKGDFIVIGTSDNEESNHNQQQKPSKQQQERQERPLGIQTGANDIFGDDSISRKSSMSETPTTPITVVSRNEREDDQRFEDILAKIGIGHRNSEQEGDDESNDVIGNKRNNITEDVDRPKKRKVEIDMEELLGEDDYRPEFGIDEEENDNNNKDTQQQNDQTEIGSTTPPFPPSSSSSPPPSSKKPPTIWNGRVNMPQVTEFDACARQIGGRALSPMEWSEVLSPTMWIEGRIPVDRVTQYVTQTQYATSREIVLLEIEATGAKNYQNAQTLIKYFDSRKRFGVVGHNKTKIKDFYLIPLYKVQQLPDCLYVVRVEETQRDVDMFLGVVVIQKPQEQPPQPETRIPPTVPVTPSVHTPAPSLPIRHQYQPPPQQRQRMPFSQQYQPPSYLPPQQRQQRLQQQQQQQPQRQRQQGQYQYQRQRQHQHQPYNPSTMYYHPPAP